MRWDLAPRYRPRREPLPCPVCRRSDQVWAGVRASQESGVGCSRCRVYCLRPWTQRPTVPKSVAARGWADESEWLYYHFTKLALKTWDRIPRAKSAARDWQDTRVGATAPKAKPGARTRST